MDLDSCIRILSDQEKVFSHILNSTNDETFGLNYEEKAKIMQWVQYSFKIQEKKTLHDKYAAEVNSYLSNKTFITGNSLTIADCAVGIALHQFLGGLTITPEIQWELCNLVRWFSLVQSSQSWKQPQIEFFRKPIYCWPKFYPTKLPVSLLQNKVFLNGLLLINDKDLS